MRPKRRDFCLRVFHTSGKRMEESPSVADIKKAWLNEKNAPEILQYEGELVSTLLAQIDTQQVCY